MATKSAAAEITPMATPAGRAERSHDLLGLFTEAQRLLQAKQGSEALLPLKEILRIHPDHPDAFNLASVAFGQMGMFEEAEDASRRAIALNPDDAGFRLNLANRLNDLGRGEEAIDAYREALKLAPAQPNILKSYMRCLAGQGRWSDAGAIIDRLCEGIKNEPETLAECADICLQASDRRQALALYQKAAEGDPERTDWQIQIARLAIVQHKQQLAKETAERVLERGEDAEMRVMLASIMHRARNLSAMAEHLDAVPDEGDQMANAANLRGMMLVSQTNIKEGLETMARTRFLAPDAFQLQSTRVMYLNYDPDLSRDDLRRQHMDFGERFKTALPLLPQDFTDRSHDPERKLRIGFVSPDFRAHSVAYFARPFFDAFDRERFDVIAYAHVPAEDSVTADLRALTTGWRDIFSWSEQQLAEEVRRDRIDILIDLTGLTRDTRIRAFTARPAPVQMTYIGYPNTTGLAQIDYRITDWITDPEGVEDDYSETLIRMPGCFLCYAIPSHAPALEPGPCEHRGYVTFGSFNNFAKVNPAVLDLWAEVLNAIPHAKLLLKSTSSNDPTAQVIVRDRLTQRGVDPKRVSFADYRTTQASHLAIYHDIDIALDTFPYNGTTTTCEALWMGVPVITLAGDRHAGRVGASLLKTVGFEAGITKTSEEFVTTARLMAENPGILRTIRRTLRDTVYRSSLCDNKTHARTLEDALRATWQIWCEQRCDRSDQGIIP